MGKYRQHATSHSIAVTEEVFQTLRECQKTLQQASKETVTLDDALRYIMRLENNHWGKTRFEREV